MEGWRRDGRGKEGSDGVLDSVLDGSHLDDGCHVTPSWHSRVAWMMHRNKLLFIVKVKEENVYYILFSIVMHQ